MAKPVTGTKDTRRVQRQDQINGRQKTLHQKAPSRKFGLCRYTRLLAGWPNSATFALFSEGLWGCRTRLGSGTILATELESQDAMEQIVANWEWHVAISTAIVDDTRARRVESPDLRPLPLRLLRLFLRPGDRPGADGALTVPSDVLFELPPQTKKCSHSFGLTRANGK